MITTREEFHKLINVAENNSSQYPIDNNLLNDLGYTYEYGLLENNNIVVDIDYEKSFYWYERAMKRGSLDATLRLADFLSEGIGCNIDLDKAICLYLICIDKGMSIAANNLATVYRDMKEYDEAFRYYNVAKELMSREYKKEVFSLSLALCYFYGIGVEPNFMNAKIELENLVGVDNDYSCQYDMDEANYLLGLIYLQGLGVNKDINIARKYLLESDKEQDHRSAQEILLLIGRS